VNRDNVRLIAKRYCAKNKERLLEKRRYRRRSVRKLSQEVVDYWVAGVL